jgi:hypothetical protein
MTMTELDKFNAKCDILSDLWLGYKHNKEYADFFDYNDIGLPLAFALSQKIVEVSVLSETYINETFDLFCEALGLDSEEEYESLDEMFDLQTENEEDDV